jgi:pimeloyl-ACP methyl ester carboxylesterase
MRLPLFVLGLFGLTATLSPAARADDKPGKSVTFETSDGVKLRGVFYANADQLKKKEAVVLLLHNFDMKTGGDSHADGWDALAEALQKDGYAVLTFDFRGFGESKKIVPAKFWDFSKDDHNKAVKGWKKKPLPETIDHQDFEAAYYPYLVNDVAAARRFLDRSNDDREINTSSLIVIGAGEGATVGALWMASEWHRKKAKLDAAGHVQFDKFNHPVLEEAEGRDLAGALWLSLSPTLAGRNQPELRRWLGEVGGADQVPMGFYYGGEDAAGEKNAVHGLDEIRSAAKQIDSKLDDDGFKAKYPRTIKFPIGDTKLVGSELLQKDLPTQEAVLKYVNPVMEDRGTIGRRTRNLPTATYFWVFPGAQPVLAGPADEETPPLIPVNLFQK